MFKRIWRKVRGALSGTTRIFIVDRLVVTKNNKVIYDGPSGEAPPEIQAEKEKLDRELADLHKQMDDILGRKAG